MKVLYDYQIFQMQNYGGISRYFYELIKNSRSLSLYESELSTAITSNEYLTSDENKRGFISLPQKYYSKAYRFTNSINKNFSVFAIRSRNYDVLHPTFYETYFIDSIKRPFVITVYDLINELHPEYFKKNQDMIERRKILLHKAKRIIAISENTKNDIISFYKVPEKKIDVTYLGESLGSVSSRSVDGLPPEYILFVGNRSGYKNFDRFYEAIKPILQRNHELSLVCAGGGSFNSLEMDKIRSDKLGDRVIYVPFTSNEELKFIYQKAKCFVFPSLYEGFGIPVLEAFAAECTLCVSYSSSLKEIGGSAALYFDPLSVEDIKKTVEKALVLDKMNAYTRQGLLELQKFSWETTCRNTLNVYKEC